MLRLAGVALVAGVATSVHAAVAAPAAKAGKTAAPKHARRRKNLGPAGKLDVETAQKHLSDAEMVRRAADDGRMPAEHVKLLRKVIGGHRRVGTGRARPGAAAALQRRKQRGTRRTAAVTGTVFPVTRTDCPQRR